MEYKNGYIFLKRSKDKTSIIRKNGRKNIKLEPSFLNLLKQTFEDVVIEDNNNIYSIGKFKVKNHSISFKYYAINENFYLDVIVNRKKDISAVNVFNEINDMLVNKENLFDEFYVTIISFDYPSEYYCNKLYPFLNAFERKLRKLLFNIYTLNFDLNYVSHMQNDGVKENIKYQSKELNKKINESNNTNKPKNDSEIKYAFYSLEYSHIEKLLFTKYVLPEDIQKNRDFLNNTNDLTMIDDKKLRKKFELLMPKSNFERFFNDIRFEEIFHQIHEFRNDVAHCKLLNKKQYSECLQLLKQAIESIDNALSITEKEDFLQKGLESKIKSILNLTQKIYEILKIQLSQESNNKIELISDIITSISGSYNGDVDSDNYKFTSFK